MHILALNPYHGGSHAAFLDGWAAHSRHTFTTLTLPAHHWKWRMRHAAATFAEMMSPKPQAAEAEYDAVFCTSMLDLAAFYGLSGFRGPALLYFHENQLTYPTRQEDSGGRDQHFALTHLTSALAAVGRGGAVGWNSAFQRDGFLTAARKLLQKMPGSELSHVPELIAQHSAILPPGVDTEELGGDTGTEVPEPRGAGPLRILWAARWEHDKDPDAFFAALKKLKKRGVRFRVSVVGESFAQVPECFATAEKRFADEIDRWGYQPTRVGYVEALHNADVVVSTARHEFFGLAAVEAVAAGCFPVVPKRLAYPEVLGDRPEFFYDGTPDGLAARLEEHARSIPAAVPDAVARYAWPAAAGRLDDVIDRCGKAP